MSIESVRPLIMRVNREVTPNTLVISEQGPDAKRVVYTFADNFGITPEAKRVISMADAQIMGTTKNGSEIQQSLENGTWVVLHGTIESLKEIHN